jgi:hypothetical protein
MHHLAQLVGQYYAVDDSPNAVIEGMVRQTLDVLHKITKSLQNEVHGHQLWPIALFQDSTKSPSSFKLQVASWGNLT